MTAPRTLTEPLSENVVFWPDDQAVAHSQLTAFRRWCEARTGRTCPIMLRWTVSRWRSSAAFGASSWSGPNCPATARSTRSVSAMPCETARFFPDLRLNYAECVLTGNPTSPS